jgi:beta,beta-carotene 9',10'-dioxygenase
MATRTAPAATASRSLGFMSMDEEVHLDRLPGQGEMPPWLSGTLTRVTPALLDVGGSPIRHWFDGLAMLNAFSFSGGRVAYASRFLQSDALSKARSGRYDVRGFATDPCRSLFKRVMTLFERPSSSSTPYDNCTVNLTRLGERYLAMTETPLPIEFDPRTLETVGLVPFEDRLGGQMTTAHPHHDRERDELVNYVTNFSARSSYRVHALASGATGRRRIASIPVREPAYMHSFGMSENYVVLSEYPFVVNPMKLALANRPLIHNYRWKPERGTRFLVIDRHSGKLRHTLESEAFFGFHHVNAFERADEVVVDIVAYDDPSIIDALEVERLRDASRPVPPGRLVRHRLPLNGGAAQSELLSEARLELPRINYGEHNARDYRCVYATGRRAPGSDWLDAVVKVDVTTGETTTWADEGCYAGEPVFVPSPGASAEDEGVVLSVVLDAAAGRSFLLVLDAQSFEEIARAEVPHHIPFGFHGQYFAGA